MEALFVAAILLVWRILDQQVSGASVRLLRPIAYAAGCCSIREYAVHDYSTAMMADARLR